jgi:diaminohydroxyphosphoribosylaminopyrimidine deaminase/5-amino-6-(5-phosphoribosylamino)uracil reductase
VALRPKSPSQNRRRRGVGERDIQGIRAPEHEGPGARPNDKGVLAAHEALMREALTAAARGTRAVRPNPKVGCAIFPRDGNAYDLVTGFHAFCGGPHAEVEALRALHERGLSSEGATVAVTLEPCSHQGRTPPCADALIAARVARVIVAVEDPNPLVKGRGLAKLRAAGIEVVTGVLAAEGEALNREWLAAHRRGRPFVTLKMATSLDGAWTAATGESKWITSEAARADAHARYRARVDAILTGRATVEADRPRFSARVPNVPQENVASTIGTPRAGELSLADGNGSGIEVAQPRVIVMGRAEAFDLSPYAFAARGEYARAHDAASLEVILRRLYSEGVHDVLVEGGPRLAYLCLEAGLVDEIALYFGARFLGGAGLRLPALAQGQLPGLVVETLDLIRFGSAGDFLALLRPIGT